jgi:hypothetical protein
MDEEFHQRMLADFECIVLEQILQYAKERFARERRR